MSRAFYVIPDTRQGRILVPFMYKVYINGLLTELNSFAVNLQ